MYFQRLTDLRKEHNLTQQDIADLLHCQREVYRRHEKGIRDIPISSVIVLAKYYKVSVDYLLGETDKRERY
ncbi:MAG: helix-turn-helix transcriptional regulator [Agathobacter sp.]|nr:helix-turn-helix transcriptional regulator [Agathobacter sp.]